MGIDNNYDFGYGLMINISSGVTRHKLQKAVDKLYKSGVRYCEDAYDDNYPVFICVGGYSAYQWRLFEGGSESKISFEVTEEQIEALNSIADEFGAEKKYKWIGFSYQR